MTSIAYISPHRFTGKEMEHIEIIHYPTDTFSDSVALNAVRFLRFCIDKELDTAICSRMIVTMRSLRRRRV